MKLSPTQINALRLASTVPSSLGGDGWKTTLPVLLRHGLIESYGAKTIGDGWMSTTYGITDAGRAALAEHCA